MTLRTTARILVVTLGLVGATALIATDAAAVKGDKMFAVINGHKVKFHGKQVCGGYTMAGVSVTDTVKPHRLNQLVRTLVVTCPVDLATSTLPVSPDFCSITYQELRFGRTLFRQWSITGATPGDPAVQVTFTAFDGTRVQGRFSGTLQPESGATTPAPVVKGAFSVAVPLNSNTCF